MGRPRGSLQPTKLISIDQQMDDASIDGKTMDATNPGIKSTIINKRSSNLRNNNNYLTADGNSDLLHETDNKIDKGGSSTDMSELKLPLISKRHLK